MFRLLLNGQYLLTFSSGTVDWTLTLTQVVHDTGSVTFEFATPLNSSLTFQHDLVVVLYHPGFVLGFSKQLLGSTATIRVI